GKFMKNKIINILESAQENDATDIHIILESECGRIKFRQKGKMTDFQEISKDEFKRLINFLKFIAELDINEHKIPQSGKTTYEIYGVVQVEINDKANISYEPLLRGALRCDPDVLMFGEIRDKTIARELLSASLSGHLVFSTFHSKSAVSTISRLKDFDLYDEE